MSRLRWVFAVLMLLLAGTAQAAPVSVAFPSAPGANTTWSTYYGYPYLIRPNDYVTGTRSISPLPAINTLSYNIKLTAYHVACTQVLYLYYDNVLLAAWSLPPNNATVNWTLTGTSTVALSNASSHTLKLVQTSNLDSLACNYTGYLAAMYWSDTTSTVVYNLSGADVDNDGYYSTSFYGNDCNDNDASVYPGATESCDAKDNNCNGTVDEGVTSTFYKDGDGDGYGLQSSTTQACSKPGGYSTTYGDCDDTKASVYPGAAEACNGIDDNCNGATDEGVQTTYFIDQDGDGVGSSASSTTACSKPAGYASVAGDCNDSDATIYPNAPELCDSKDNNCNGTTDEGAQATFYRDADGDGYGTSATTTACTKPSGYATTAGDCDDTNASVYPGATEVCNSIDDNCNGSTDEGVQSTFYKDGDGDGYGTSATATACSKPTGYASVTGDCDDTKASVNPGASETCNSVDDNCDGVTDEGVTVTFYRDQDSDNYGTSTPTQQACSKPSGYASVSGDCNDTNAAVNPGATEACNGIDDNCNGSADEGVQVTYYKDSDGDSYGQTSVTTKACVLPAGYASQSGDCNDNNAAVNPGAREVCNGIDDNCSGTADEGVQTTYYKDSDGDSYGQASSTTQACVLPSGYASRSGDCDDTNAAVNPGATEACNGIDDNCDGKVDDNAQTTYYKDSDGDSYGQAGSTTQACTVPSGYATRSGDCNDADASIHPGATETCDSKDNNCDGVIDEGVQSTFYKDSDADGYGLGTVTRLACSVPAGYAAQSGDCDDTNAAIHPDATEVCNSKDDNCNGAVDENVKSTFYADSDKDGFGDPVRPAEGCTAPANYVADNTDCNDSDASIHPGATEICNNKDDDCDSTIDEGVQTSYYQDGDADTYGNPSAVKLGCERPVGYVANNGDCDDANASVHPGVMEICNSKDDNCDGQVDEGAKGTYYGDGDGDGYGDSQNAQASCARPDGFVSLGGDCNDQDTTIYPGSPEQCNGVDDNCDGTIDEAVQTTFYLDVDGDTFGDPNETSESCLAEEGYVADGSDCDDSNAGIHPGAAEICGDTIDQDCNSYDLGCDVTDQDGDGASPSQGDCDDTDASIHPGAAETCDGKDNDCDGQADNIDGDGDGYVTTDCGGDDCVDTDPNTFPGADEIPGDGVDNDCNGQVDEGPVTPTPTPDPNATPTPTPDPNVTPTPTPADSPTPTQTPEDGEPSPTPTELPDGGDPSPTDTPLADGGEGCTCNTTTTRTSSTAGAWLAFLLAGAYYRRRASRREIVTRKTS